MTPGYNSLQKVSAQTCFPSLTVKKRCATKNLGRESSEKQALNPSVYRAGWRAATPGRDASCIWIP